MRRGALSGLPQAALPVPGPPADPALARAHPPRHGRGLPERLDPAFIRWIWDFHRTQRPRVLELLDGWVGEVHTFHTPAQCAAFLAQQKNRNTPGTE
ncbi:MAG: hypothetical protein ACLTRR_13910 [Flavonifractor plautii]